MKLDTLADVRSGSLLDRGGAEGYYVLAGDITANALRTSRLVDGKLPGKSSDIAALAEGDIVMAMRGAGNPAAVVPSLKAFRRPIFTTQDVAVVRPCDGVLPAYLAWFLNDPLTQEILSPERTVSAAPRLPLPALRALVVPLPSLERQAMIAAIAAEALRERSLVERIRRGRERLLDDLLRRAASGNDTIQIDPPPISGRPS